MAATQTPTAQRRTGPPDEQRLTPMTWARANLFNSAVNGILTVVLAVPLAYGAFRALQFVLVTARWSAISANMTTVMVGLFPRPEIWRAWVALYVVGFGLGVALGAASRTLAPVGVRAVRAGWRGMLQRAWPLGLLVAVLLGFSASAIPVALTAGALIAVAGGFLTGRWLPARLVSHGWAAGLLAVVAAVVLLSQLGGVPVSGWGGLLLTLTLATGGIVLSFPFGVLAALGRRSSLPAFKVVSVLYIELIRGVPLITLLLMGSLALGFFLPQSLVPGDVVRAIIMMVLFTSAYVAEIVRGGLQSVPSGQTEAAQALGMRPVGVTRRIVLPQALRNVIPAMVGQFISLFKDTSLVAIIGLLDLLQVVRSLIPGQPQFQGLGLLPELLTFAAFVYWAFAYTMSRESQRLETRLGVGER